MFTYDELYGEEVYDMDALLGAMSYGGYEYDHLRSASVRKIAEANPNLTWELLEGAIVDEPDIFDLDAMVRFDPNKRSDIYVGKLGLQACDKQVYYGKLDERFENMITVDDSMIQLSKTEVEYTEELKEELAPNIFFLDHEKVWSIMHLTDRRSIDIQSEKKELVEQALIRVYPILEGENKNVSRLKKEAITLGYLTDDSEVEYILDKSELTDEYAFRIRCRSARNNPNIKLIRRFYIAIYRDLGLVGKSTRARIKRMMKSSLRSIEYAVRYGFDLSVLQYGLTLHHKYMVDFLYSRGFISRRYVFRAGRIYVVGERFARPIQTQFKKYGVDNLSDIWKIILGFVDSRYNSRLRLVSKSFSNFVEARVKLKEPVLEVRVSKHNDKEGGGSSNYGDDMTEESFNSEVFPRLSEDCFFCYVRYKVSILIYYREEIRYMLQLYPYLYLFEGEMLSVVMILKQMTFVQRRVFDEFFEEAIRNKVILHYSILSHIFFTMGIVSKDILYGMARIIKDRAALIVCNVDVDEIVGAATATYNGTVARFVYLENYDKIMLDVYSNITKRTILGYTHYQSVQVKVDDGVLFVV